MKSIKKVNKLLKEYIFLLRRFIDKVLEIVYKYSIRLFNQIEEIEP